MNSIWRNLYDHFKDRCYGGIFMFAMVACTGLAILIMKVFEAARHGTLVYWLPVVALFAGYFLWSIVRRVRRPREQPWKNQPLSGDDLRKARVRLMNCRTLKKS